MLYRTVHEIISKRYRHSLNRYTKPAHLLCMFLLFRKQRVKTVTLIFNSTM